MQSFHFTKNKDRVPAGGEDIKLDHGLFIQFEGRAMIDFTLDGKDTGAYSMSATGDSSVYIAASGDGVHIEWSPSGVSVGHEKANDWHFSGRVKIKGAEEQTPDGPNKKIPVPPGANDAHGKYAAALKTLPPLKRFVRALKWLESRPR